MDTGQPSPPTAQAQSLARDRADLFRAWRTILKHKWLVLGTTLAVFTAVMAWNLRKPKIYQATAYVIIDPFAPKVLGRDVAEVVQLGSGATGVWASSDYYNTQSRILKSWSLAEKIVRRFDLHRDPKLVGATTSGQSETHLMERATAGVQSRIMVMPVKDSRVFGISIRDGDPQFATDLANKVAQIYTEENLSLKREVTRNATSWMAEQVDQAKERLKQSEQALYEFRLKNNILSVALEDSQNMITKALEAFSTALTDTQRERIELESRRKAVELLAESGALEAPLPSGTGSRGGGSALTQLETLRNNYLEERRKLRQLEERYGPKHAEMVYAKARLEAARGDLEREAKSILKALNSEIEALGTAEKSYQKELARLKAEALRLNEKEVEYKRLGRDAHNGAEVYTLLVKRYNEAGLQEEDHANNIRLLDRAMVPTRPVEPDMKTATALAIALALFVGVGLATLIDFLDRTVKSQEDVEAVARAPVLGFIPSVEHQQADPGNARELYIMRHPNSTAAESCRVIRTNIMFCSPDRPLRTLVVTSSNPAEGKTLNVVNLGVVMAQGGHRTLIVDSDMRRPRLHKVLGIGNEKGLSSLIVGDASMQDAVKSTDLPNLFVLPCGPTPPNPAELLQTEKFSVLVQSLLDRYDRVIFDSPPLLAVTDAAVLSRVADGIVLIVRAGRTTRDALYRAKRQIENVNAHIAGVIINDVNLKNSQYAGYYYYYYNHQYHEKPASLAEGAEKA